MQIFEPLKHLIQAYLPEKQIEIIQDAYTFASQAHEGQFRSSGEPYITHPVSVGCILAEMRLDSETIAAALLHDVIEDTSVTYEDITKRYGHHIAELVEGVSKLDKLKFRTRQEAQAENFRKMVMAMVQDVRVILIKLADRTHNMRTLGALRPEKRRRIAKETLEIYAPLAYRLGIHNLKTELEELGFSALYPNRANVIRKVINAARGTRKEMIQKILSEIQGRLNEAKISGEVEGYEKNIYNIYLKMQLKEQKFHSIMDIFDFRIIVKDVDACYRVLGLMHNLYKPRISRFRDYIAIPKANGYQSLHTSMIGPRGVPVEVQIRTEDMNQMAEMGIAAHWVYSEKDELNNTTAQIKAQRWMQNLLELQQSVGSSFEFIENVKSDLFPKEIYVFTPKGRIVELPEGATAVDFAYAVHTDIGHHCVGAIVDRNAYSLYKPLDSGQTVEIITDKESLPNAAWLNFVVSSKARSRIRQALKNLKREEAISLGRRLLNRALSIEGGIDKIPAINLQRSLEFMKLETLDDLLAEIGSGNIMSGFVARGLENSDIVDLISGERRKLALKDTGNNIIHFAKCCHPIPNDAIIGYVSPEKGLTIHHEACRNISDYRNEPEKYISFEWTTEPHQKFTAELRIEIKNNQGALASIISIINDHHANVQGLSTDEKEDRHHAICILIEVNNTGQLNEIMDRISTLPDVVSASRNIN
ncbi:bifunctional GTP diphosphokinase/guanosine-3',5'-bis pyrophosphate 3'-pyrophosphohydrolase [Utexia brackfieldae]|uniref:bifunctional GTP diphosphokinase/guanosine-3',5'-bis pyrophosphate 3'-pyrophosphohydrolase n=1 Tax=Utexia brackfieldae TaxID=3074108 RepID=UPI00370DBCDC